LEEIAGEKAGIIKKDKPVIIGEKKKETEPVFRSVAKEKNASLLFAEDLFEVEHYTPGLQFLNIHIRNTRNEKKYELSLDLPGIYQSKNIITVLSAVEELKNRGWNNPDNAVIEALQNVKKLTDLHGRWEVLQTNPTVVLEVAHNPDGITEMLRHIEQLDYNKLHIIFGVVKDKEIDKVLALLPKKASYYFTQADIPRALDKELLKAQASNYGLAGNVFDDVNLALQTALANASADDLVIICGSIFLVAEVNRN